MSHDWRYFIIFGNWLRYVTEDQLKYMFEGYFEQKRQHRLTAAIGAVQKSTASANNPAVPPPVDEKMGKGKDPIAANKDAVEIYATKEVKLIGIDPNTFKLLQRSSTVRKMRRSLGIQVSLVILVGADSTFSNGVLSDESRRKLLGETGENQYATPAKMTGNVTEMSPLTPFTPADAAAAVAKLKDNSVGIESVAIGFSTAALGFDDDEYDEVEPTGEVDFPERYELLKRRARLGLQSLSNSARTRAPELIAADSAIVQEVVRIAANIKAV
eukprot:CAMPEP_0117553514 /NCGR_PEP_ID=MMETSP0784-20121206/50265_1 /TAXON_ID=39447 /ORGANISM="" /LENGTH=270 /DNA_ID=CAMNT_0005350625 /DNA_START=42 /DNA_END=851 /DNA_ORIENTATION=-